MNPTLALKLTHLVAEAIDETTTDRQDGLDSTRAVILRLCEEWPHQANCFELAFNTHYEEDL